MLNGESIVLYDARGACGGVESRFRAATVQTRPPAAVPQARSSRQRQQTTAGFMSELQTPARSCLWEKCGVSSRVDVNTPIICVKR